jgi:hypothetical protein
MPNLFPDIAPDRFARGRKKWQNRVPAADAGLQVNVPHPTVQHLFKGAWTTLSDTDLDTIVSHNEANAANVFTLFDFNVRAIPGGTTTPISFGTGDGATLTFTLPAKAVAGLAVYDAGSLVTNGIYSLSVGTGADGEDQVVYGTSHAPTPGHALTFSCTSGRRRWVVWYTTLEFWEDPVEANIWQMSIDFEEKVP